jgi:type IV secretion system protein TrbJ
MLKVAKSVAAKTAMVLAVCASYPASAGIPVIDAANLSNGIMNTMESVAQTLKQIAEYKLQLDQYQDQLKNTAAPAAYIWDNAVSTMNNLRNAMDTLKGYKTSLGSLNAYLDKFQDVNYYKSSPCFTSVGCTPAQWQALKDMEQFGGDAQKKTNDALLRALDQQQDGLNNDAAQLQSLQAGAQGSKGRMEAIQFANQIASQQANQLLQIRALLIAQQNAITTRNQALSSREAKENAASEQIRKGTFTASPLKKF